MSAHVSSTSFTLSRHLPRGHADGSAHCQRRHRSHDCSQRQIESRREQRWEPDDRHTGHGPPAVQGCIWFRQRVRQQCLIDQLQQRRVHVRPLCGGQLFHHRFQLVRRQRRSEDICQNNDGRDYHCGRQLQQFPRH